MKLSLNEIFRYLDGSEMSRCINEGERILDANHLIESGITETTEQMVKVLALCLQSSAISSNPHCITGSYEITPNGLKIESFKCTCVAGEGGTCKHISATLIQCTRLDVLSLKKLSCTDIKCIWAQKKGTALEQYKQVPVQDYCCTKRPRWMKEKDAVGNEDLVFYQKELLNVCQNSGLRRHKIRVTQPRPVLAENCELNNRETIDEAELDNIKELIKKIVYQDLPFKFVPVFLCSSAEVFYGKNVAITAEEAAALCIDTVSQSSSEQWHKERSIRVTGSTCYTLFTYCNNKNPDWVKKMKSFNFWGDENTAYGQRTEKLAIDTFIRKCGFVHQKMGMIIHPQAPWFGFSPDGIIKKGEEVHLLEVKCPIAGKTLTATEAVKNLPYLKIIDGQFHLKQRHRYYGQVQLGLALCGLQNCKFVIFSSIDNSFVTIDIPFNIKFSEIMLQKLSTAYFNHILPTFII